MTKRCCGCHEELDVKMFYEARKKPDGRQNQCKACGKKYRKKYDETYIPSPAAAAHKKAYGERYVRSAHGRKVRKAYQNTDAAKANLKKSQAIYRRNNPDKKAAHTAVSHAVRAGRLPRVSTCDCAAPRCDKRAETYHHSSYAKEHWFDVDPLCIPCHKGFHAGTVTLH